MPTTEQSSREHSGTRSRRAVPIAVAVLSGAALVVLWNMWTQMGEIEERLKVSQNQSESLERELEGLRREADEVRAEADQAQTRAQSAEEEAQKLARARSINSSLPTSIEGVQTAAGNAESGEEQGGILPVSWPSVSLPKITMPRVTMPKVTMPKWPTNADGSAVSPFAPITAGASKISAGTQKVWEGTKEMLGFGSKSEGAQPAVSAASPSEPSLWQRMIDRKPEPDGPQTVAEWMAQPRVGN